MEGKQIGTRQWLNWILFTLVNIWTLSQACPYGFYGPGCFFPCSGNCRNNATCNTTSGFCDTGCRMDYTGSACTEKISGFSVPKEIAFVVASLAVLVVFTSITLPLVLYYRSRYIGRHRKRSSINPFARIVSFHKRGSVFGPSETEMKSRQSISINTTSNTYVPQKVGISELANLLRYDRISGYTELTKGYQTIHIGENSHIPCTVSRLTENQLKNRSGITLPYDHSRVKLLETTSDYINASNIESEDGVRYIASQGPQENTVADHWTMIWQERISVVVMLTNFLEDDKERCCQYWHPKGKVLAAGSILIHLLHEKAFAFFTVRSIKIEHQETKDCRLLSHFQFTRWTDRQIPYPSDLIQCYRAVKRAQDAQPVSPLLVHCSDGGGRSGTFIALDVLHRTGLTGGKVNVARCLTAMCEQRMNMVENLEQYILLHQTLQESFHQNVNYIRKEWLREAVTVEMMKPPKENRLRKEFCELMSVRPIYEDSMKSAGFAHLDLNLLPSVLPVDEFRVTLSTEEGLGYYNAVSFPTITDYTGIIAAQYPDDVTATDLIRLLVEQKSPVLVTIHPLIELHSTKLWYPEVSSELQPFKIQRVSSSNITDEIQHAILLIENSHECHRIHVLEIMSWTTKSVVPRDAKLLATVIKGVQHIRSQAEYGPITVMSFDGAAGCGVFIAAYNATQQVLVEGAVNLFSVVHDIHVRRPEMMTTMDEYEFCYRLVTRLK
ncbi:receptor-type tyrosine-protein phosphatase alpha-like isoform X2 [Crassostrea virginica]